MSVKEKIIDGVAVLTIKGNLMGGDETEALREKVYSLLDDDMLNIVVDLGKVRWMNSTGLGVLLASHTSVVNKGGVLKLARPADKVKSLIIITQLVKIFEAFETIEEAVESYK